MDRTSDPNSTCRYESFLARMHQQIDAAKQVTNKAAYSVQ